MNEKRSDAFWLGMALAAIHLALLVFLAVLATRTGAMMLFRKESPTPAAATQTRL